MAKFEKEPKKAKIFKAQHSEPGDFQLDYILLPIGYVYNKEWLDAKRGDSIRLFNGGTYKIFSVRKISMVAGAADILSRIRYGITIKGCLARWQQNAKLEGHSPDAVSERECLWVIYEKGEPEEN